MNEAVQESQVTAQISYLEDALAELRPAIDELRTRLENAISIQLTSTTSGSEKEPISELCPLAGKIARQVKEVKNMKEELYIIRLSLEN
ncbi:hypothetical protein LCGC14_1506900 [marine sediment metagenome]|uniref:Uncharacterized protein n=1 Tax=marine sediment metagenome TaxID=412755 RepID=A0A0F9J2V5_9ZZZZ